MSQEMSELVRRQGASVRCAPALSEEPIDCAPAVRELLARLEQPGRRAFIFLTGVGVTVLLKEAERQGCLAPLVRALSEGTIVCRGPKPTAALRRYGISPSACAREPYTSVELLESLDTFDLTATSVTLVHYGERSDPLADAVRARGIRLDEICVYEWRLPADTLPLQALVRAIVSNEIDALVFTSQVQWRHLAQVASELGLLEGLISTLRANAVVVASIGPVCSAVLINAGIQPDIEPASPKMAPLVSALVDHFTNRTPGTENLQPRI
jgi:uroporphyrinogen-III synthase